MEEQAIRLIITAIIILLLSALCTGLIFYPLVKNNTFLLKYKYIIVIFSIILFLSSLNSFMRNFDYNQDPDYNASDTYNMLLFSWCALSISLFLIIFIHKKV